jgi:excisionase family DNA binding protein
MYMIFSGLLFPESPLFNQSEEKHPYLWCYLQPGRLPGEREDKTCHLILIVAKNTNHMNLYDILKETPNLNVTISGGQLIEAIDYAIDIRVKAEQREQEDVFLTTEEACKMARVSRPTLHRWKSNGLIPFIKVGKNVRYRKSDLTGLLRSKRTNL